MKSYGRSRRVRRDKWANRMAIMGITLVVMCLAAVSYTHLSQAFPGYKTADHGTAYPGHHAVSYTHLDVYKRQG